MTKRLDHRWVGVLLIFSTYFYFLIFAQFAFLEMATQSGLKDAGLKVLMGAMAVGGLVGSFLVPLSRWRAEILVRCGLFACFGSAVLASLTPPGSLTAALIGLSVGVLTVSLAIVLRRVFPQHFWGIGAALGTGAAYFLCNVPYVFEAAPRFQAVLAGSICLLSAFSFRALPELPPFNSEPSKTLPFFLLFFGALVWLDSAAFYIIQHSPLKEGTWTGHANLWRNAIVHLSGALLGGWLAQTRGFTRALAAAFAILAPAALLANSADTRPLAGWLYPAGVSIYSACLVAFPAFGPGARDLPNVALRAAFIYSISGWICSGLGIGMGQNLHRVPWQFVATAGALLTLLTFGRRLFRREVAYSSALLLVSGAFSLIHPNSFPTADGRAVYLAEGCINCHSQYVKPGSPDELLWGPPQPIESLASATPPLFGNRRQGPDLLNIGNRRSRTWLKEHFLDPRALSPGSSMPRYDHLFQDSRGDALVDYLTTLGRSNILERLQTIQTWRIPAHRPGQDSGRDLFATHCAVCHGPTAEGNGPLRDRFTRPPANLRSGPAIYAPITMAPAVRRERLAQIIKFGIPGTDMPGHEYFSDKAVLALTLFVERLSDSHNESPRSGR